jgi:hypothetical protein
MVPIDLVDASPRVCSSGTMTLQIFMRSDPIAGDECAQRDSSPRRYGADRKTAGQRQTIELSAAHVKGVVPDAAKVVLGIRPEAVRLAAQIRTRSRPILWMWN